MLRYCSRLHENQVCTGDETFKFFFNCNLLIVNGSIDKQQKFHPTGTRLCSHCEQSVHFWGIAAIKTEGHRHFNDTCTPKEKMNDCSDGMFGAAMDFFPDADYGQ